MLIPYPNKDYIDVIGSINGCDGFLVYRSFQFKCLEDSALLMAAVGILFAFNMIRNPAHLYLQLDYTRISWRFLGKIIVTLIIPIITLAIFVNPLWNRIDLSDDTKALLIWGLQVVGFFFATFFLIFLIPIINKSFGFEVYRVP